jgi:hypothetical protein
MVEDAESGLLDMEEPMDTIVQGSPEAEASLIGPNFRTETHRI